MGILDIFKTKKAKKKACNTEDFNIIIQAYTKGKMSRGIDGMTVYEIILEGEREQNKYFYSILHRDLKALREQGASLGEVNSYFENPFIN